MTTPTPLEVMQQAAAAAAGTPNGGQQPPATPPAAPNGGTPPPAEGASITQEHMNHLLAVQKRELQGKYADYDDVKQKAAMLDDLVNASRSVEEQAADLTAKLATKDRDLSDRDATILRQSLAGQANLPFELWGLVGGADETTIKNNIDILKRHMAPAATPPGTPPPQQTPPAPTPGQGRPPASGDGQPSGSVSGGRELFAKTHGSKDKKGE